MVLGIRIVDWDWALELGIGIGNWGLRLGIGIVNRDWDFGLGFVQIMSQKKSVDLSIQR